MADGASEDAKSHTPEQVDREYHLELYKSLRKEAVGYVEKVPALWLQKFALAGGVIAFLVAKHADIASVGAGDWSVGAAVVLVPVLAALLDAKIAEYTLHARAISRFLAGNSRYPAIVAEWEGCMWGDEPLTLPAKLARLRSALTIAVTVIPTAALMFISGIVLAEISKSWTLCVGLGAVLSLAYLGSAVVAWFLLWPRQRA